MQKHTLVLYLALVLVQACSVSGVALGDELEVHRAARMLDSEQMMKIVREQELGCDPCSEVLAIDASGDRVRYIFNPKATLSIEMGETKAAWIRQVDLSPTLDGVFQLGIELSEEAQVRLASIAQLPASYGANFRRGRLIGVGPIFAGPYYTLGLYRSRNEADRAAETLGVEVSFVPAQNQ